MNTGNALKAMLENVERVALWQKHQQAIEALQQEAIASFVKQLQAQIGEYWRFDQLDQFVDLNEELDSNFKVAKYAEQLRGMTVVLSQETEGDGWHRIVTPRLIEADEEINTCCSLQLFKFHPKFEEFGGGEKNRAKRTCHPRREYQVLFLVNEYFRTAAVDILGVQQQTKFPNYEWSPVFDQLPIGAEELQKTDQKVCKVLVQIVRRFESVL